VAEFHITLNQVNWLGNIVQFVYLPTALLVPLVCNRYGLRRCVSYSLFLTLLFITDFYPSSVRDRNRYSITICLGPLRRDFAFSFTQGSVRIANLRAGEKPQHRYISVSISDSVHSSSSYLLQLQFFKYWAPSTQRLGLVYKGGQRPLW
jgi:hypothetical protein